MSQCESCPRAYVLAARENTLANYGISPPGIPIKDTHMRIICYDCCYFLQQMGKHVNEIDLPKRILPIYGVFNKSVVQLEQPWETQKRGKKNGLL
jgi:hypothetical protein